MPSVCNMARPPEIVAKLSSSFRSEETTLALGRQLRMNEAQIGCGPMSSHIVLSSKTPRSCPASRAPTKLTGFLEAQLRYLALMVLPSKTMSLRSEEMIGIQGVLNRTCFAIYSKDSSIGFICVVWKVKGISRRVHLIPLLSSAARVAPMCLRRPLMIVSSGPFMQEISY